MRLLPIALTLFIGSFTLVPCSFVYGGTPAKGGAGVALTLSGWKWQAVISQMNVISDTGFTAILLPPHTATCSGAFGGQGYDPCDFSSFDGGFGSESELRELLRVAHSMNIDVYADMIMNHTCTHADYRYNRFSWNDFHHYGAITDWNNPFERENHDLVGLNDLAQESPYVRGELWNYLRKTNDLGFDGYRWDGVKHVPHWYWKDHVTNNVNAWGKFSFGEVYDADLDMLRGYADLGMAVTDYNLYHVMYDVFKFGGDLTRLDNAGFAARNGSQAVTFVENHYVGPPENRLLAYAFIAGYPGYPFFANIDLNDSSLKNLVWIHRNLASGSYINRWREHDLLIFEREGNLLVGINQSDRWQSRWVDSSWTSTRLHDFSGNVEDTSTYADNRVLITIPPMSYVMMGSAPLR